jgi:hypothetical protein
MSVHSQVARSIRARWRRETVGTPRGGVAECRRGLRSSILRRHPETVLADWILSAAGGSFAFFPSFPVLPSLNLLRTRMLACGC